MVTGFSVCVCVCAKANTPSRFLSHQWKNALTSTFINSKWLSWAFRKWEILAMCFCVSGEYQEILCYYISVHPSLSASNTLPHVTSHKITFSKSVVKLSSIIWPHCNAPEWHWGECLLSCAWLSPRRQEYTMEKRESLQQVVASINQKVYDLTLER